MKTLAKVFVPAVAQNELYRLRTLGPRKYGRYTRLEHTERRKPRPSAGEPFDIGAPVPIVLHASTVAAVDTHWVKQGHPIRELRAFKALAAHHSCLLDVGAAEGIFSAAFCALTGRTAWAFEPSPEMFARLGDLRRLNPEFDIRPFNLALGERAGIQVVNAYADGQFSGAVGGDNSMAVMTLDSFCDAHGLAPDLAKIDVEGMELAVLRGGCATFAGVQTILLEVHGSMLLAEPVKPDETVSSGN